MAKKSDDKLPINYQEQLAKEAAEISKKIAAPSGDRIRMSGPKLIAPDGQEGETLEVIVIDFVSSNLYYDDTYDRDNPKPPACFAIGPEPTMLVPSTSSPDKQSDTCSACPNNQFGSRGKGKACKNTRVLAVVPITALDTPDEPAPIWIMSIPPTSVKVFDAYVQSLVARHNTVPIGVVTQITMDQTSSFSAPKFSVVRPVAADEFPVFMQRRAEAQTRLLTEPDVSQYEPPKATRRGR